MIKNLYKELEVKENATQGEIKSSYRRLVKQHHPDAGGEKDRFLAIQDAWETLNDPFKNCLLYTSPSPRDLSTSRMPSSA